IKSQRRFLATGSIAIFAILALSLGYVAFFGAVQNDGAAWSGSTPCTENKFGILSSLSDCTNLGSGTFVCNSGTDVRKCFNDGISTFASPCVTGMCTEAVLKYSFEELTPDNKIKDDSGRAQHGTCTSCPAQVNARVGQGLQFTSSVNPIDFSFQNQASLRQFTILTWIKPDASIGSSGVILTNGIDEGDAFRLYVTGDAASLSRAAVLNIQGIGSEDPIAGLTAVTAANKIRFNEWNHVAVTVDLVAGNARFYIDGVESTASQSAVLNGQESGPLSDIISTLLPTWRIGRYLDTGREYAGIYPEPFSGVIDEVKIVPRIMTPTEIQVDIARQSPPMITIERNIGLRGISGNIKPALDKWELTAFIQNYFNPLTPDQVTVNNIPFHTCQQVTAGQHRCTYSFDYKSAFASATVGAIPVITLPFPASTPTRYGMLYHEFNPGRQFVGINLNEGSRVVASSSGGEVLVSSPDIPINEVKFDDSSQSARFTSIVGASATACTGGALCPFVVPGLSTNAAYFDGINSVVGMPLTNFGNQFTLFWWMRPTAQFLNSNLNIATAPGFSVRGACSSSSCTTQLETSNGGSRCALGFIPGKWSHFALSYDNGNVKLYKNGQDVTGCTHIIAPLITQSSGTWQLGLNSGHFDAALDEVLVYSRVMSDAEIQNFIKQQNQGIMPGTETCFDFRKNQGEVGIDCGAVCNNRCNPDPFDFEAHTVGSCPAGWQCSGDVVVETSSDSSLGIRGTKFLAMGRDSAQGTAISSVFALPSGVQNLKVRRGGFGTFFFGLYKAVDGSLICGLDSAPTGFPLADVPVCGDISSHAGQYVRIRIDESSGVVLSSLFVDDIRAVVGGVEVSIG
ncbi:MAG TPA: LamG domain-containing protein, partial [Candidatus Nanoarchaeia archaeon]|nr:LamG domain-containing protein [Candidatus Nanoarchaeia archaeon]